MDKNIKRIIGGGLLACTTLPTLIGCGNSFKGITVTFWHTFGHGVTGAVDTYAKEFANLVKINEGVDVRIKTTYKGGYGDLLDQTVKSLSTSGNPTLVVAYPDHVADYMYAEGVQPGQYVVDLTSYVDDSDVGFGHEGWLGDEFGKEDFVESYYEESITYQRAGTYTIPFLRSTEAMLYDMEKVKLAVQLGCFDELETNASESEIRDYLSEISWPDFMDACANIYAKKADINDKLVWPVYYDSDANMIISRMFQQNVEYSGIDNHGVGYIGFDGRPDQNPTAEQIANYESVQAMLRQYKDWYDAGVFNTKGVLGEYSSAQFKADKCIFAIGSTGGAGYSLPEKKDFNLGVCKVPAWNNNPAYVTQGPSLTILHNKMLINEGKDNDAVKYAWKFIKFLTNGNRNAAICSTASEGYNPVRRSAFNSKIWTDYVAAGGNYIKVLSCVTNEINERYFHTVVFNNSAKLRDSMESILADTLKIKSFNNKSEAEKALAIRTILDRGISNAI